MIAEEEEEEESRRRETAKHVVRVQPHEADLGIGQTSGHTCISHVQAAFKAVIGYLGFT
jgi:hypothetical protein